ncbi:MAG: GNAT family N-acetyltransferase [Clostridiales bacterium]|nr:GNAT family N-acetyltransferase [Clostridiales bacterium]
MNVIVREATKLDYEEICKLYEELDTYHRNSLPQYFSEYEGPSRSIEYINSLIEQEESILYVSVINSKIIGLIQVYIKETPDINILKKRKFAYIDSLYVKEEYRKKGIGKLLFNEALNWIYSNKVSEVELNVWQFNQDAINFYKKWDLISLVIG